MWTRLSSRAKKKKRYPFSEKTVGLTYATVAWDRVNLTGSSRDPEPEPSVWRTADVSLGAAWTTVRTRRSSRLATEDERPVSERRGHNSRALPNYWQREGIEPFASLVRTTPKRYS